MTTRGPEAVSQAEFAALVGLTSRSVFNLRRLGLPAESEGRTLRIPLGPALQWYIEYQREQARAAVTPTDLEDARLRYERARAQIEELKLERLRATLLTGEQLEQILGEAFARIAARLTSLPPRLAQSVVARDYDARLAQAEECVAEVRAELYAAHDVISAEDLEEGEDEDAEDGAAMRPPTPAPTEGTEGRTKTPKKRTKTKKKLA